MRDRLIRMLCSVKCEGEDRRNGGCSDRVDDECVSIKRLHLCQLGQIVDHLLANGVIVPPCKVGDMVWFVRDGKRDGKIEETTVEKIVLKGKGVYIKLACNAMYETSCNSIGKTVFLTRGEAERALKGENHAEIH